MKDIYIEIDSVPDKLLLAEECWQCGGSDTPMHESWADDKGQCFLCNGTGMRITANGKAILALLALKAQA